MNLPPGVKVNRTNKFSVVDLSSVTQGNNAEAALRKQHKTRANKESGERSTNPSRLIGGDFEITPNPSYIESRLSVFDRLWRESELKLQSIESKKISITLPNGDVKNGLAFKTTPMDIAKEISIGLADLVVISKVFYTTKVEDDLIIVCDDDEDVNKSPLDQEESRKDGELWDLSRPLIGDCVLNLLKYDDPESKIVFSHSSAHILGAALEAVYGAHLTIGPPLQSGFYYDSYIGSGSIHEEDLKKLDSKAEEICKKKYPFQRLVISKEEALELFAANPFKINIIKTKIPDGAKTTVYRCGPLVDLCMGPHLPNTGKVKALSCIKTSSTNWLGQVTNDPLQRVYGIAFPDKASLKQWQEFQEKAKQRDHRLLGTKQELFFFHPLSPGSCFWLPHGARIYNKLISFIKTEYWNRGYEEVITPNIFNLNLWEISGHAIHYKENMFTFDVEGQEWGMKPMNCPAHCIMFANRNRSYRELPWRVADFGVLHRNELSGALTGLTRVRRFQQDDAHIFCRQDQIKAEILGALDFMRCVYTRFGMSYKLELSTRPTKALGDRLVWDQAEQQLTEALNEFAGHGNWRINPGDGAFYGPKIDIKVFDAMDRVHQCATVQLDFQLPIRFNLDYKSAEDGEESFQRPVMVHRAILGSVERMTAVLTEHYGGKWPFWLSPRQFIVVPIDLKFLDYAFEIQQLLHEKGFYADVDDSNRTFAKKVREGQLAQYNFILVVGQQEVETNTVNIRTRENEVKGAFKLNEALEMFSIMIKNYE